MANIFEVHTGTTGFGSVEQLAEDLHEILLNIYNGPKNTEYVKEKQKELEEGYGDYIKKFKPDTGTSFGVAESHVVKAYQKFQNILENKDVQTAATDIIHEDLEIPGEESGNEFEEHYLNEIY